MKVQHFQGFSLVELMVALLISSILLGGVITMLSISKRTYNLQDELSVLQDNARFLLDELTYKIRMAGYQGCSGKTPLGINPAVDSNPFARSTNSTFPNSDQINIIAFGELLPFTALNASTITLDNTALLPPFLSNQIIVSDCGLSVSYNATRNNNILTLSGSQKSFNFGLLQVFNGIQETRYWVADDPTTGLGLYKCQDDILNGRCDDDATRLGDGPQLIGEGVQNMQVYYGIKANNGIQFIANPSTATQVKGVRITLLMRTPNRRGIPTTNKEFYIDGTKYNPSSQEEQEGYRHRLFTTTISVRN